MGIGRAGRSQEHFLPWVTLAEGMHDRKPEVWFHDIFQKNGKPYRPEETKFIGKITSTPATSSNSGFNPAEIRVTR